MPDDKGGITTEFSKKEQPSYCPLSVKTTDRHCQNARINEHSIQDNWGQWNYSHAGEEPNKVAGNGKPSKGKTGGKHWAHSAVELRLHDFGGYDLGTECLKALHLKRNTTANKN